MPVIILTLSALAPPGHDRYQLLQCFFTAKRLYSAGSPCFQPAIKFHYRFLAYIKHNLNLWIVLYKLIVGYMQRCKTYSYNFAQLCKVKNSRLFAQKWKPNKNHRLSAFHAKWRKFSSNCLLLYFQIFYFRTKVFRIKMLIIVLRRKPSELWVVNLPSNWNTFVQEENGYFNSYFAYNWWNNRYCLNHLRMLKHYHTIKLYFHN